MSSNEDPKAKDVTEDAPEASHAHSPDPEKSGGGAYLFLSFVVGFALSLVVGWMIFPQVLYLFLNKHFP